MIQHLRVTRISSHGDKVFQGVVAEIVWQRLQTILSGLPSFDAIRFGVQAETPHIRYEVVGYNEALWLWAKDGQGEEELYRLAYALASEGGWGLASRHTYIQSYDPQTDAPMGHSFFGNKDGVSLSDYRVGEDGVLRVIKDLSVEPRSVGVVGALDSAAIWEKFKKNMLAEYAFQGENYKDEMYSGRFTKSYHDIQQRLHDAIYHVLYYYLDEENRYDSGFSLERAYYKTFEWIVQGYYTQKRGIIHEIEIPQWVSACVEEGAFLNPPSPSHEELMTKWRYTPWYEPEWTIQTFLNGMKQYYPLATRI